MTNQHREFMGFLYEFLKENEDGYTFRITKTESSSGILSIYLNERISDPNGNKTWIHHTTIRSDQSAVLVTNNSLGRWEPPRRFIIGDLCDPNYNVGVDVVRILKYALIGLKEV